MNTVEETVLLYAADNSECNATDIFQQLKSKCPNITKPQINKILYDAEKDGIAIASDEKPPLWSVTVTQKESRAENSSEEDFSSEEDLTMVLIDLDTSLRISDCLEPLKSYINSTLDVLAFKTTNFGIKREIESSNFKFILAYPNYTNENKHIKVVGTMLTWYLCESCQRYANKHMKVHFIVVSKNTSLTYLPGKVGVTGHKCTVVKDWSELRLYVE